MLSAENDWKVHKSTCIVALKPLYLSMIPRSEPLTFSFIRSFPSRTDEPNHSGSKKGPLIKIQVPLEGSEDLLIYNEKRIFKCVVSRRNNPAGYNRIELIIRKKGSMAPKGISPRSWNRRTSSPSRSLNSQMGYGSPSLASSSSFFQRW